MRLLTLNIFVCLFFLACKVDPKINLEGGPVAEITPKGWPKPIYTFSTNTLTEAKFQLGRALFYDPILSLDSTISCGSCHQLEVAFADRGHSLSHGIKDSSGNQLLGTRNTSSLFNLNWKPHFMHDGGINHIEVQPLAPITNSVEMGESINNVIKKIQRSARYRVLFGKDEINSQNMLKAMAQFMGMLYSYNSKYDKVMNGNDKINFTTEEQNGYNLFMANCNSCHKQPLFSDFEFRNNGLGVNIFYKDSGRAHITGLASDRYKFKTPSLRNIERTWPYMHDGRFETLEECLNHYTSPFTNLVNIDPQLPQNGFQFNAQQKSNIIAFLKTLTDFEFINNSKFKDPTKN